MSIACVVEVIHKWQTLVAGMLALLGAGITVWMMRRQLSEQRSHQDDLRRRKFTAARAILPENLSAICAYATECARMIHAVSLCHRKQKVLPHDAHAHTLRNDVPSNLQRLIEHLDESDAEKVADLLGCFQVQRARFEGALIDWRASVSQAGFAITRTHVEHPLIETIRLYLLAENMFDFARREADHIPSIDRFGNDDVKRGLKIMMPVGFPRDGADEELLQRMQSQLVSQREDRQ